ncbi:hypothetical protein STSP2_01672 [Anaerohalosphaera lusitana]|uniref:Uncharacterized protein n=1 Tax=Anaerohalosphaera lusitana TaxID=1936003 RepID=A0A1U9NL27_9BACT|nr:hypothetical protein [Anaerohalosphaera lusitana]AQT68507.1 hypothetical protein STSP2_01672 [Anaerohalosphaera lusitana]
MAKEFNPTKAKILGYAATISGFLAILIGLLLYFARPDHEHIMVVLLVLLGVGFIDILLGVVFFYTARLAEKHFQENYGISKDGPK